MYLEPLTILVPTHIRTIHTSFSHNYNISLLWFSSIVNNVDIGIMELWHLVYLSITKFWNSQQIFYIYVYLYTYYITIILTSWINKYVCRTQQRLNRRRQNEIMAKIQAAIIQIPKPEPNRTLKALEAQKLMKKKKEAEVSCGHLLLSFLLNIGVFFCNVQKPSKSLYFLFKVSLIFPVLIQNSPSLCAFNSFYYCLFSNRM